MSNPDINLFRDEEFEEVKLTPEKVVCLGMEFESDEARRAYFREELRKKLPELRQIEGFPIGEDEDIINLSDPPYYTACPILGSMTLSLSGKRKRWNWRNKGSVVRGLK